MRHSARKTAGNANGRIKSTRAKLRTKRRNGTHKTPPRGRAATVDPTKIQALKARGLSADKIADKLKISKSSVYRYARAA
jgi:hypothetical protein